jgi:hypothetical protein
MFYTYTNWKSAIHNRLCAPNQQYWLGVELALKKPWFLMTISQTELVEDGEEIVFRRDIMVANVAEIEQLAKQEGDRLLKLESAMIVIPNWINGISSWSVEPLAAVWEADEPDAPGAPVEICETQSGAKFVTTFGACTLEELTNQTLRYRFPVK